jgi:hypothetical protein
MGRFKRAGAAGCLLICSTIGTAHGQDFDHANWNVDPNILGCPKILKANQTLTLTLGAGHGSELAIMRANGVDRYDLISRWTDNLKPLMTGKQFASARSIKIPTTIKWHPYTTDARKDRVFAMPGWYIVYVSDNLEAGAGGYTCTFRYIK